MLSIEWKEEKNIFSNDVLEIFVKFIFKKVNDNGVKHIKIFDFLTKRLTQVKVQFFHNLKLYFVKSQIPLRTYILTPKPKTTSGKLFHHSMQSVVDCY